MRAWKAQAAVLAAAVVLTGCGGQGAGPDGQTVASVPNPELAAKIAAYMAPLLQNHDFSGVIAIGRGDETLFLRGYGMASYELGVPNGPGTRFRVASVTKTFTAGAVLMLRDQGKLALDDPLSQYMPDFPRGDEITLRHLLMHSSGAASPADTLEPFRTRVTLEGLVQRIQAEPLQFDPGTEHRYSNAGYNLLAYVIQQVGGEPYDDVLRRLIFTPLGMEATGNYPDAPIIPGRAVGYLPAPGPDWLIHAPWHDIGFATGSGSLTTTAGDLLRWGRAVARESLFSWQDLEWPYGWGRIEVGEHQGIQQTGATTGFMSSLSVFPDDDVVVLALHNMEYGGWVPLNRDLCTITFGEPYEIPAVRPAYDLPAAARSRYTGRYQEGNTTMTVAAEDGALWMYFDDWPIGKYLTPRSLNRIYEPANPALVYEYRLE